MAQQYRDPASNVFWVINFNWTAGRTDLIMTNTPHWLDTGGYCDTGSNIIIVYRLFWYNCTWTFILEPSGRKCLVGGGGDGGDMTPWGDIGFHQVTVAGTGVWLPGNILTSHSDQQYPLPVQVSLLPLSFPGILCQIFLSPNCFQMIICGSIINCYLGFVAAKSLTSLTSLVI